MFPDILTNVATTMKLEQLVQVFPQRLNTNNLPTVISQKTKEVAEESDNLNSSVSEESDAMDFDKFHFSENDLLNEIQNYEPYVVICKETMHANQIKKLITATAQQLLCTLNL